ncbi:MAG: nuclear transport factor 2 family protein [Saprospiraceae bacterium]
MEKEKCINTVQQIYADFGAGNVEGVLNSLTEDISWNDPGSPDIPYAKKRNGKKEVMNFFMEMGGTVSFTEFAPQEFYADNNAVVVKGFFAGKANGTGKNFESEWIMIWKFKGDKVNHYQAFVDTQKMINAIK